MQKSLGDAEVGLTSDFYGKAQRFSDSAIRLCLKGGTSWDIMGRRLTFWASGGIQVGLAVTDSGESIEPVNI